MSPRRCWQLGSKIAKAVQLRDLGRVIHKWQATLQGAQSFSHALPYADGGGRPPTPQGIVPGNLTRMPVRIGFCGAASLALSTLSDQPVEFRAQTPVENFDAGSSARLCTPPAVIVYDDGAEISESRPASRGACGTPQSRFRRSMEFLSHPTPGDATPPQLERVAHVRLPGIDSPTRARDLSRPKPEGGAPLLRVITPVTTLRASDTTSRHHAVASQFRQLVVARSNPTAAPEKSA